MKICQVVTGLIPIPNNRWGATEKVIWNYKTCLETKNGVNVSNVTYLNEVQPDQYDIVHIHMANLCLEAKKRAIPYIFSIHDHHVEYHGKGSFIYNQNLEAIKGSIFSITHAEHYIDLFDETDKLFYLRHGVDTNLFTPKYRKNYPTPKLLMVANNGLAGDYSIDRKGFEIGIKAAMEHDMHITIIGAEANQRFFEARKDLTKYPKLTLVYDNPTDDFIRKAYDSHHIFLHPSMLEAGHPNLTLLEAMASNLIIVGSYKGSENIPNMIRVNDLTTEAYVKGIAMAKAFYSETTYEALRPEVYELMYNNDFKKFNEYDWTFVTDTLLRMYQFSMQNKRVLNTAMTRELYINSYNLL